MTCIEVIVYCSDDVSILKDGVNVGRGLYLKMNSDGMNSIYSTCIVKY